MKLFDLYLNYMTEILENKRSFPDTSVLLSQDPEKRFNELSELLKKIDIKDFVQLCAKQDNTQIPNEILNEEIDAQSFLQGLGENEIEPTNNSEDFPKSNNTPDPDKGKHVFEVFLDCIAQDENLVFYLIQIIKDKNWKEFYKLSMITTKMDLDPKEFLFWLGNREYYASQEERECAIIMDNCMQTLFDEGKREVMAALLSGDQQTFELYRCESSILQHLPNATFEWYSKNYLDRDYPIRVFMKCNGVEFPTLKGV